MLQTYEFKVQAADSAQRFVTLGKVTTDLSRHVDARSAPLVLAVPLSGGSAKLAVVITASPVKVRGKG